MKIIKLNPSGEVFVDDEDFEKLNKYNWWLDIHDHTCYATRSTRLKGGRNKTLFMHRVLLNLTDSKIQGDHKDGNGLNNQKDNLRTATQSQNNYNKKPNKSCKTGLKGSYPEKRSGKFISVINLPNKRLYLGRFNDPISAAKAYDTAAIKYLGEFARTNKSMGLY